MKIAQAVLDRAKELDIDPENFDTQEDLEAAIDIVETMENQEDE